MRVTVVIPVRDDPDGLRRALTGLARQTRRPDEVLIVSAGETSEAIKDEVFPEARRLSLGPVLPGAARNHGAAAARNPWIAFLDAGTEPVPVWLEAFGRAAAANPEAEVLFGTYEPRIVDEWDWAAMMIYVAPPAESSGGRYPTTASFCVHRKAWEQVGGMRGDLRAGEDLLFFDAIAARKLSTVVAPEARVEWELPNGLAGHFGRLRRYSRATWATPLARRWQVPVLRMYAVGVAILALGLLTFPPVLLLLPALVAGRLAKSLWQRRGRQRGPLTPVRLARLVVMMLMVDVATVAGTWDGAVSGSRSS